MRRALLACVMFAAACGSDPDPGNVNPPPAPPPTNPPPTTPPPTNPPPPVPPPTNPPPPPMCTDVTVFADADGDSYGTSGDTMDVCLLPGENQPGYAREAGDCRPADAWANPTADEICGDYVDDNCDSADGACPTTQTANLDVPAWDCVNGAAPANVYAYALFADGGGYYRANGCFVFFEGLPNEFYVQRVNFERVSMATSCTQINGCVCPSDGGWPSYDRRLFAWTLAGDPSSCSEIRVIDHGGENQQVSNDCRKYLYQMHWPGHELSHSYIAGSVASMEKRITLFPTVEVACASEQYQQLPFRTLLTATITKNTGFVKK